MKDEQYINGANRWLSEENETDISGNILIETAKFTLVELTKSKQFNKLLTNFIMENNIVSDDIIPQVVETVMVEIIPRLLKELPKLI
jgi:hypothetical protein